ncbi:MULTISPECIES: response regulator [unclassified Oceanispirochaeta]|uniref:response regulator n=1 Tax=unclassified Oceanispirochaeta TaxID=2635722 RepID=UPI000E08D5E9|nr:MULTISPECIES: response regulator [unclassified Oceanispirochaeta]MBF9017917.1 response regulator [Oceanispirochaeta sp. M2]NPD74428.1 response regulator [Oceanispirochaeta sp. M1]RDG29728.1 response regulator [Oceanispirochaeta sp. M1]
MNRKFFTVQTKLLAGFIGILLLAGFAGITGFRGISEINYQNTIGVIIDELTEYAEQAQAASLRYIIYEDDSFHDSAIESADKVLELSKMAESMMLVETNRNNTEVLVSLMDEYRELISSFRKVEHLKIEAQKSRNNAALKIIIQLDSLLASLRTQADSAVLQRERKQISNTIDDLYMILSSMNEFRTDALNYVVETTDDSRESTVKNWLLKLDGLLEKLKNLELSEGDIKSKRDIIEISASLKEYRIQIESFHEKTSERWMMQYNQRRVASLVMAQVRIVRDGVQTSIARATENTQRAIQTSLIFSVLFSILIAFILSRNITIPLVQGISVARNIASGNLENIALNLKRHDELGELATALDTMAHSLQVQNWLQEGKQGLDDELRGDFDIKDLSSKFISFLTRHMDAQLGAIYLFDEQETLELVASYAFTDRAGNFNRIKLGEGFIGQAAMEKEVLYFSKLEEAPAYNYGADEQQPEHFMTGSLVFKDELIAAFLIGSFTPFNEDQKEFISANVDNAAVLFNAAKSRDTISQLLLSSQQQQEELKKINEELGDQTRALQESEAELQAQQEELRVTNEELEERTQAIQEQRDSIRETNDDLIRAQKDIEKKASDLEQASRYKSEFLANMSHELRTPLNSILILAQLLSNNSGENLTEKQVKSASAIHASGSDLLKLINDILDLSKVEAGKVELNIETVSFSSIIEDLKRVFTESASEKGLELNLNRSSDVREAIRTDGHRLQQVIRNLLTNSIKFTETGSVSMDIVLPEKSWKGKKRGEYFQIRVTDTGIGIPEEKQAAIFEAFQQADGSTIRKYGGTGLGLSISRELSKLLGGELQLESEEGRGSTFMLTLPYLEMENESETKAIKSKTDQLPLPKPEKETLVFEDSDINDDRHNLSEEDKTILIIEDDPNFVTVLSDLVKEKGFKTLIASDGETGLHFADYYKPNAIILDIGLPGIDGWTVMERLKENSELRHIPVHFMSGNDDNLQAMRMGAIGYLTKPVSISDVESALCKIDRFTDAHISTLLVVEDDDVQRDSIRELIGNDDVEIHDVSTGAEAFEALHSSCYDCMILDLGLKDMSGFDLLEKINNDPGCSRIPIIIYTGRDLSKKDEESLKKYAESIIIKGVKSPERLLDETSLFLHRVESKLPEEKRKLLKDIHSSESVLENRKILLVDDDMRNVFALTSILEEKQVNIVVARDGAEAVEKVNSEPGIDLVLMDIMMPNMDGYEAMRQIRKNIQFRKLPIIALTAKAMKGDRNKCIEAGASDYLAKPVETDKLLSMLRVWLYK